LVACDDFQGVSPLPDGLSLKKALVREFEELLACALVWGGRPAEADREPLARKSRFEYLREFCRGGVLILARTANSSPPSRATSSSSRSDGQESARYLPQHLVPPACPVLVVDLLQAVGVAEEESERRAEVAASCEGRVEAAQV